MPDPAVIPAALWPLLGLRVLSAMLMRRWPRLALYEALAASCTVLRMLALPWPTSTVLLACDLVLFVLPTTALVVACEAGAMLALSTFTIPPTVMLLAAESADARRTFAAFGVALIQGIATAHTIGLDFRDRKRSWERRAAAVLGATAVLSMFFARDDWSNVVGANIAAHAFVLLAYLRHGLRENRGDVNGVGGSSVDESAPAAVGAPRAEAVEQTEERP